MKHSIWLILAAVFLSFPSADARAGFELVVNGDFETGNFDGWVSTGMNSVKLGYGLFGGYGVRYGTIGSAGQLYQTIDTNPGDFYRFTFWQQTRAGIPNEFQAYWNGALILDLLNTTAAADFTQYTFTEVATKARTEIRFGLRQDPGYSAMDAVSVQLAESVPEPSSLAMLAVGASLGLGALLARSRRPRG